MKRVVIICLLLVGLITIVYLLGPTPEEITESPEIDFNPVRLDELEDQINSLEEKFNIKPDNEAEVVWINEEGEKAPCAIVYLHGFSASKAEGEPVHREIAKYFGCNLYLARLESHGLIEEEPMLSLTADGLIRSAKEAVNLGKSLGKKLIVMGTSTGGTLALFLASANPEIDALVLYSPNIEVYDPRAGILNDPWGLQIARMLNNSKYHSWEVEGERKKYWTHRYRYEALTELQQLLEETMTPETFTNVRQPVFVGYYYKNDEEQDLTVSVQAMLDMYDQLGTPGSSKVKQAFPETGHHVIASELTSDDWKKVKEESIKFLEKIVGLD